MEYGATEQDFTKFPLPMESNLPYIAYYYFCSLTILILHSTFYGETMVLNGEKFSRRDNQQRKRQFEINPMKMVFFTDIFHELRTLWP